jgi:hypothetical protein
VIGIFFFLRIFFLRFLDYLHISILNYYYYYSKQQRPPKKVCNRKYYLFPQWVTEKSSGKSRAMAVCTFLDSTIFSRWHGGALNYSTAPHRSKTTLISNGVFCLLESKILSIGQTLLYSLG